MLEMSELIFAAVSVLMLLGNSAGYVVKLPTQKQHELLFKNELDCNITMQNNIQPNITGLYCNRTWDGVMCWPDTVAGIIAYQHCPNYINYFETEENASRICLPNGSWYDHPRFKSQFEGWTNFYSCRSNVTEKTGIEGVPDIMVKHINEFQIMYNTGYALSLVSLVFAVIIMVYFRKLHCNRNYIHLNLFASFILRAGISLLKDNLLVEGLGFPDDVGYSANKTIYFKEGPHWKCRLFFTVFQYGLTASYTWIFVEAVYLHMLIFVSIFTEKTRVLWYMVFGWTVPIPFVIAWGISRAMLDNNFCWNIGSRDWLGLIWIIQAPIYVTIVINFFFFINIVRVLFTKLNSSPCLEAKKFRYRRLAKSTLVLIPVFGVYYILFTYPMENLDGTTEFIMLLIEMFFNSFQGFFIAIVLCFVNTEVRTEIMKAWRRRALRRNSGASRASHASLPNNKYSKQDRETAFDARFGCCGTLPLTRNEPRTTLSSVADIEETMPLSSSVKTYSMVLNGSAHGVSENDANIESDNDKKTKNPNEDDPDGKVELKIKFVNIECDSKDGSSATITSVDIEKFSDGNKTTETIALNNNRKYPTGTEELKSETIKFIEDDDEIEEIV